jgi:hypothetical protein
MLVWLYSVVSLSGIVGDVGVFRAGMGLYRGVSDVGESPSFLLNLFSH